MIWRERYVRIHQHNAFHANPDDQIIRDDEERRRMYEDREVMRDQLNELRSKYCTPSIVSFDTP
jgi:hypothetical protein